MFQIYRLTRDESRVRHGERGSVVVVAATAKRARSMMAEHRAGGDEQPAEWLRLDTRVYRLGLAAPHLSERVVHEASNAG